MERGSIYRLYKRAHPKNLQIILDLSRVLDENLLVLFHPEVKPLPNPLQAELDKYKGYEAGNKERERIHELTLEENRSLRSKLEMATDLLKGKMGR
jgi:hypothetical protein